MLRYAIATIAAIVLTVCPAIFQGDFVNRWGAPANLSIAGQRMHQFPRQVGAWASTADERPLSEAVCRELGLVAHFHRQYKHTETGERLDVLLMVGPPGRLVRHPPDVCYANRANQQVGNVQPLEVSALAASHQFKLLNFKRVAQPMLSEFSVAYAFTTNDGLWNSPSSPRMTFGGAQVLYKLQVLTEVSEAGDRERLGAFLEEFVQAFPIVYLDENAATASQVRVGSED